LEILDSVVLGFRRILLLLYKSVNWVYPSVRSFGFRITGFCETHFESLSLYYYFINITNMADVRTCVMVMTITPRVV